jgi:hypothetical protein
MQQNLDQNPSHLPLLPSSKNSSEFPEWTEGRIQEAEGLINALERYFPKYSLPNGVKVRTGENSWYHGRDEDESLQNQPLIDVSSGRELESLCHELGHDVFYQEIAPVPNSTLVSSIFNEFFADLTQLKFTQAEPADRKFDRGLSKYHDAFEGVDRVFKEQNWEISHMHAEKMLQKIESNDYINLIERAEKLALSTPVTSSTREYISMDFSPEFIGDYAGFELEHFILDNILGAGDKPSVSDVAESSVGIYEISRALEREPKQAVEDWKDLQNEVWGKLECNHSLELIENNPTEALESTLELELKSLINDIESILPDIRNIDDSSNFVLNSISQNKYGTDYTETIDYPHNLGGVIAEDLYKKGYEPLDILENPQRYINICAKSLRYHIGQNL